MSNDRDQEPERDDGPEPTEQPSGADGMMWVYLPIGFTFLVLGMAQGIGDGSGTAFFVIGLTFMVLALTTVGAALGGARGRRGPGEPDEPDGSGEPDGGSGAEGAEPGGPART